MDNLHRCHIVPTALCNLNHSLPEDPLHAIWECSALGIVWSSLLTFKQSVTPPPADFFNLLSRFLQIHDNNRAEFFLSVLLGPCGISETPFVLASHPSHCTWFALLLDNFSLTIAMPKICIEWPFNLPLQINGVLWPHILSRKTLTKRSSVVPTAGLRFIIRDNHSEVIWGLSMRIPLPPSIAEVEALACCRGV